MAAGKQPAAEQDHHDGAGGRGNQAIRRDLENPEPGEPLIAGNRIDNQVGRGSYQGGRTAQYADEAQRDQQFLGREAGRPRQADDDRNQDDHDRRVVHEGGGDKGAQKHLRDRQFGVLLGPFDDEPGNRVNRPGPEQGSRKDEHGRDGDRCGVGKDREQSVGIDDAEEQEHTCAKHRDHCSRKALHHETGEHEAENDEPDDRLVGLDIFVENMENEVNH